MALAEVERMRASGSLKGSRYRLAKSRFECVTVYGGRVTLARVQLYTGRTHQIRVHALDLGLPVIGDPLYRRGDGELPQSFPLTLRQKVRALKRQMLHASYLAFIHPTTGEKVTFKAEVPDDFRELVQLLDADQAQKGRGL